MLRENPGQWCSNGKSLLVSVTPPALLAPLRGSSHQTLLKVERTEAGHGGRVRELHEEGCRKYMAGVIIWVYEADPLNHPRKPRETLVEKEQIAQRNGVNCVNLMT